MRAALRNELMKCFASELQQRAPMFCSVKPLKIDGKVWQTQGMSSLTLFVLLQPFRLFDRFAVEIAWSEDGSFPFGAFGKHDPSASEGRARINELGLRGGPRHWDISPETALPDDPNDDGDGEIVVPDPLPTKILLPRVHPLVKSSVESLVQHGLPLLREAAKRRGITIQSFEDAGE